MLQSTVAHAIPVAEWRPGCARSCFWQVLKWLRTVAEEAADIADGKKEAPGAGADDWVRAAAAQREGPGRHRLGGGWVRAAEVPCVCGCAGVRASGGVPAICHKQLQVSGFGITRAHTHAH